MIKQVIDRLRQYYKLDNDMSDKQVAILCTGSLGEAIVNINIAKEQFIEALRNYKLNWYPLNKKKKAKG